MAMAAAVTQHMALTCALGFDGDGDRCGVVDDTKATKSSRTKIGLMLARDISAICTRTRTFVVDVKSTGLYVHRPIRC